MGYGELKLETLLFQKQGGVGIITLNRPQRLNAISELMQEELTTLLDEIEKDNEMAVVILTGASRPDGRPCFSAGADLKEMQEKGGFFLQRLMGSLEEGMLKTLAMSGQSWDRWQSGWDRVQRFSKPIIAAIDGICTAGGLELALCCDIRVVSETAEIRDLHMRNLGAMGGGGLQTNFPPVVGAAKAKEMLWTGDAIDGKEAWRIGFAQQVFPPQKLMEGADELAKKIAAANPLALRISKLVINASASQSVSESLRYSALGQTILRYFKSVEASKTGKATAEKGTKEA